LDRDTLSHYKILEKVGAGGMGEVYLAEDTQLKRKIALKVLSTETADSPERLARFKREAEMVAALNHPNIVTIHSVEEDDGIHFLTMEWVEGKTLGQLMSTGTMSLDRVFELAIPTADAVAAAHDKGITHRDLKPANIMVTDQGRVKVLDFGLAKLYEQTEGNLDADQPTQALTQEGLAVGTVPYMSPEQVRGDTVDQRSDIFSLGIVLYEMVAGQRPFQGQSSADLVSSILRDAPASVTDSNASLPHHLGRVIHRCLEKDPEKRYQTAKDVRNELEGLKGEVESGVARVTSTSIPVVAPSETKRNWLPIALGAALVLLVLGFIWVWTQRPDPDASTEAQAAPVESTVSGSGADRIMAVVLPFENLGPAEDAYFAAGVTDEISGRLASVSGLGVISRKSAAQYAETDKSMQQIGDELGVNYVIDGTVRWAKQATDQRLWTEIYDREIDDIFEVQSEIAGQVIDALGVTVLGSEENALEVRPTDNVEAYQAFLRAREYEQNMNLTQNPVEAVEKAVELYQKAVELDPSFLEAWGRLAQRQALIYVSFDRTEERLAEVKLAVEGAKTIGEDLPWTRLARGYYHYYGFREYDLALEEFLAAAESRPNDPDVIQAIGYIYRRQGRWEESLDQLNRALEIDPQDVALIMNIAAIHRGLRQGDKAIEYYDRAMAAQPSADDPYLSKVEAVLDLTGDVAASRAILEEAPGNNQLFLNLAWMWQAAREREFSKAAEMAAAIDLDVPTWKAFVLGLEAWFIFFDKGLEASRGKLEAAAQAMEDMVEIAPGNADFHSGLSTSLALLGEETRAIQEARLAVDIEAKDAFSGPTRLENLAQVYAWTGRSEESIDLIERLLTMVYEDSLTVHRLRQEAWWDALRDNPRFRELIAE
jgi:serine/threonine protein kinase/tetratricopeptide (TPR) repeat protein